jgi:1-acyl-sn-glycerol-3-phosphate acyltransferase
MRTAVQWVRSLIFNLQMYLVMAVMALAFAPLTFISRRWAFKAVHSYCHWVRWTAGWMVGLRSEIRGEVPDFEAIVASKHQSFFDIIMIVSAVPEPKFIMKKEILWTPIVGFYGRRLGCIPVDRGKRGQAI